VEHVQESIAPTLACVCHALARGGSAVTRRVTTGGGGWRRRGDVSFWLGKLERNRSNLDQTEPKTPKTTRTKENVTIK
jgi:hypothetical protein